MLLASPHPTLPTPKIKYADNRHCFLPKISESFPYSGWNADSVRKYPVAIQEVEDRACRSVPMVP